MPVSYLNGVNRKKHIELSRVASVLQRCEIRFCRWNGVIIHTDLTNTLFIFKVLAGGTQGRINLITVYEYMMGGSKENVARVFEKDKRYWTQIVTQKNFFSMFKNLFFFFCSKGGQTEVAQRGCGVSILGDTQNLTGHGPNQPAVGDPALSREVGLRSVLMYLLSSSVL